MQGVPWSTTLEANNTLIRSEHFSRPWQLSWLPFEVRMSAATLTASHPVDGMWAKASAAMVSSLTALSESTC